LRACRFLYMENVSERGDNIIENVCIKFYLKLAIIFSFLLYFWYETEVVSQYFLISNFRRVLYVFFWVIPRRLSFICRRFGTLCYIFIGK
jgi:hypothetical protein